ncbi:hypothetical protein PIB30_030858 [Stylosanthes scabra]|uniref:Uncharacterized protein n=1 Tax=Stylosanthes scabra TaxID=79078 RepID=A0ABU6VAK1_9FABA|nr:hypothetical protein [Stylosanthes scabra]
MIDEILMAGDDCYRPDFDGTQVDGSQVHLDLNEPVSGPSQAFMALGGTPPSAHVPGASWEIPFMAPASVPTPPASPAPTEQSDEPEHVGGPAKFHVGEAVALEGIWCHGFYLMKSFVKNPWVLATDFLKS